MDNVEWTAPKTAKLIRLASSSLNIDQIAVALSVTRGAVAGKVKRLRGGRQVGARQAEITASPACCAAPTACSAATCCAIAAARRQMRSVDRRSCRYELNGLDYIAARQFRFCGLPAIDGTWCARHRKLVYAPTRMR
jgi:hypothetical protein